MDAPPGLLNFFVLEASEYAERLDGALVTRGAAGPDAEALARHGRALRGTATMSRLTSLAELAGAVERVGRALQSGAVRWSPGLAGATTGAVDEIKLLIRAAREWTPEHDARARARAAEVARMLPAAAPAAPPLTGNAAAYLGGEVSAIATGLMAYLTTGGNEGALALVGRRARAVLGVATAKDAPPVSEVVGAVERTAARLERHPAGERTGDDATRELFSSAASVLQRAASDLRAGRRPDIALADQQRFDAAIAALEGEGEAARVIPIAQFFPEGGGDNVRPAPNPPMTARARFRAEMIAQAEHLRSLVAEARATSELAGRARVAREIDLSLRGLERTSQSFGEGAAAAYFTRMAERARTLDAQVLGELDHASATLAAARHAPARDDAALAAPLPVSPEAGGVATSTDAGGTAAAGASQASEPTTDAPEAPEAPVVAPVPELPPVIAPPSVTLGAASAPVERSAEPATLATGQTATVPSPPPPPSYTAAPRRSGGERGRTPTGQALQSFLQQGLSGLGQLQSGPLGDAQPRAVPGALNAPVELSTVYTGRAALARAREIRDTLRRRTARPDPLLEELFDLLDRITPE